MKYPKPTISLFGWVGIWLLLLIALGGVFYMSTPEQRPVTRPSLFSSSVDVPQILPAAVLGWAICLPMLVAQLSVLHKKIRLHPITAFLLYLLLALLVLTLVGAKRPREWDFGADAYFAIAIGGYLSQRLIIWLFGSWMSSWIFSMASFRTKQKPSQRIGVRHALIWTGLIAAAISLVTHKSLVPVDMSWSLFYEGIPLMFLIYTALGLLLILPFQLWLRTAQPFMMAVATMIAAFFSLPILVCLVLDHFGLIANSAVVPTIQFCLAIGFSSFWLALWTLVTDMASDSKQETVRSFNPSFLKRCCTVIKCGCFAFGGVFWLYVLGWCVVHFLWMSPNRNVENLAKSRELQLLIDPTAEIEEGIHDEQLPDLVDVINDVDSRGVEPENNCFYHLAKLSKIDREGFTEIEHRQCDQYLQLLGLTPDEINETRDCRLSAWLRRERPEMDDLQKEWDDQELTEFELVPRKEVFEKFGRIASNFEYLLAMENSVWTKEELPLASKYCNEHRDVIQGVRKAIACENYFSPRVGTRDFGYRLILIARDILAIAIMENLGKGELDRAIDDCELLWRLGKELSNADWKWGLYFSRISSRSDYLALVIVGDSKISETQSERIARSYRANRPVLNENECVRAADVACWLAEMNTFRLFSEANFNTEFARILPNSIDWWEFKSKFFETQRAFQQLVIDTEFYSSNFQLIKQHQREVAEMKVEMNSFSSVVSVFCFGPKNKANDLAKRCFDRVDVYWFNRPTFRRLNEIGIAIKRYERTNGELPVGLNQLVPDFLADVPMDPFSGKPFIYLSRDTGFVLYSVGDDGVDGNGTGFVDLLFDAPSTDLYRNVMDIIR